MAASGAPSLLIVDDEELTCWALGKTLQSAGWAVRCAHSAEEALERLNESAVDIVVTDVGLPEMDGFELLRQVRQQWPESRCFVITAAWDESVRERATALGAVAALPKPLDLDAFKRTVTAVASSPPRGAKGSNLPQGPKGR